MRSPGFLVSTLAVLTLAGEASPQAPPPKPAAPRAPVAKPTPPPPPVLEGVVRGPDRKPIEKALVAAAPTAPPVGSRMFERPPAVSTRTDAAGRFRLTLLKHEPQTVRVEAPGLAAATRKDVAPGTPLTFDLTAGGTIEGSVRDGDTGQPAAGLRVTASSTGGLSLPDEPNANRVVVRTDANGRFKLEGLAKGLYYVSANGRGRGAAGRSSVRVGTRLDLVVFPSGSLYGTVLGADGRPVKGATVATAARPWGFGGTEGVDDRGAFEMNGIVPGTYDVIARAPGLAPAVAAEIMIDRRTEARVDLVLRPGARVVGRLVDASERPLAGKVAVGDLDGRPTPRVLVESLRADAGADGRFAIEGVPAGAHALGASAPGQAAQRVEVDVREGERQVDVGDVRLEVGLAIRGRVRSKSGQPIADAAVRASVMRMGNEGVEARSEADGSFVVAGLEQATYRVAAEAAGFGPESKTAEPGGEPLDLVLSPAGTLTGRVVDERGQPVDSFRVSARSSENPGPTMRMPRMEETTSEDGRFTLANVAPGSYVVTITAPERAQATLPAQKVAEGQSVDVGTVTLRAGGSVRGTVVDATGAGVSGAGVTVVPAQGMVVMFSGGAPEATTDASGAFELKGLEEGSADLTASHPNYAGAEPVTVKVEPAKPVTDVRLVLPLGGRIEGSVRRRDGTGRSGLMVNANASGLRRPMHTAGASATTQPDGSFVMEHVPAGRVTVMVFARMGGPMGVGSMRTVDVRDGETTTVEIVEREILLSGRVTRSGAPGSGLRLDAQSSGGVFFGGLQQGAPAAAPTGPQRMTALTREDGSFEMLVDEPGTIYLNVASTDGKVRLPSRMVEVPDADAHTVDIAYNGVAVSGVVIDKETEAPVPYSSVGAGPRPDVGRGGTGGLTGQDGRFQLELEPGDYHLSASQREGGYGSAELDVTVGTGGLADLRLALPKGLAIAGKVTDATGRPAGGVSLRAVAPESGGGGGWAQSLPDGSFEIGGLKEGTYALAGDGGDGSFVVRPGVAAGARNVSLALQPGVRVTVTVKGPDGGPMKDAYPTVSRVNGVRVGYFGRPAGPTDAQGRTELMAPSGDLQVWVRKDPMGGGANVSVGPGESASVSVTVKEGNLSPP